jgi:hypothetical protein
VQGADEDKLLLWAEKIPDDIRRRVVQRPDAFRKIARLDDESLGRLLDLKQATFIRASPQVLRPPSLRVARDLTRAALVRLCGLDPSHLSLYERGRAGPRPATLARLVRVLGPGLSVHVTPRG